MILFEPMVKNSFSREVSPPSFVDNAKSNPFIFWIPFLVFLVLYFFLKIISPVFIEKLYYQGSVELFNRLLGVVGEKSLEFYQGRLQEVFWGPFIQIISISLLIGFSLKYLQNVRLSIFACAVFLYLLITKFEVLFFPPYGETGAGPLAEAVWLYRHHFDYIALAHQPNVDQGGPKVYLFSLYPSFVAGLLTVLPSVKGFIFVYHLLMFAAASVVAALFRSMAGKIFPKDIAVLLSIVLLALPIFQSMVEVINMEMLCLFFVTLSAFFLAYKKIGPASVAAVLAAFIKAPGGIACAAVFVVSVGLFLFDPQHKRHWKFPIYGAIALILGCTILYLLRTFVSPVQTPAGTIKILVGLQPVMGCRYLLIFLLISVFGMMYAWFLNFFNKNNKPGLFFIKHYVPCVSFAFILSWFGMYLNLSVMGPRYKLLLAPFLVFCVFFAFASILKSPKVRQRALFLVIFLASLGSYGFFHKDKIQSYTYAYNELERSLEYRNDLALDVSLAKILEKDFSSYTIGAPWVIAQELALPELGYVSKSLDVMMYGFSVNYGGIKDFPGFSALDLNKTIYVGFRKDQMIPGLGPIDPQKDKIIREIAVGDKEVVLFQGGFAIEKMRLLHELYRKQQRVQSNS